jgi:hypothetical protein
VKRYNTEDKSVTCITPEDTHAAATGAGMKSGMISRIKWYYKLMNHEL